MFVKLVTADKDKSAGITLPADKKSFTFSKTKNKGYLGFKCAAVTAGDYLYVNLTGTDVKSYSSVNSIAVTKDKAGTKLTAPTLTISSNAGGSTPSNTAVKAKCPSFGDAWVHW